MTSQAEQIRASIINHKWEPSRHYLDFHIAGFTYYEGLDVIDQLILGQQVQLVAEPDNPHDPEAVAIYFQDKKLGYVPAVKNGLLSTLLYYGHGSIFESQIQFVSKESHPERQFRVVVKIRDKR
ncbi:MAG: HIRAN domain-containing protein [Streptococcaceae bacterium]|nr:HIRAN domain-containing protein [Streptococcaceae bacterium]